MTKPSGLNGWQNCSCPGSFQNLELPRFDANWNRFVSGRKEELVQRLSDHYDSQAEAGDGEEAEIEGEAEVEDESPEDESPDPVVSPPEEEVIF